MAVSGGPCQKPHERTDVRFRPARAMVAFNPRATPAANDFYAAVLRMGKESRLPLLAGGSYAINAYTGQNRGTKDVDFFCKAGDYPRLLAAAAEAGFETEVEDDRWIAKIKRGKLFCDVIWGSANMVASVSDGWFEEPIPAKILDVPVKLLAPTELIWSKAFIMDRTKFDGGDVAHIMLREHKRIDWPKLLNYFELYWEVLLAHVVLFRFIYPSERNRVPDWVMDELLDRLDVQRRLPLPLKTPCRGRLFSRDDYQVDVEQWGYADVVGDDRAWLQQERDRRLEQLREQVGEEHPPRSRAEGPKRRGGEGEKRVGGQRREIEQVPAEGSQEERG